MQINKAKAYKIRELACRDFFVQLPVRYTTRPRHINQTSVAQTSSDTDHQLTYGWNQNIGVLFTVSYNNAAVAAYM